MWKSIEESKPEVKGYYLVHEDGVDFMGNPIIAMAHYYPDSDEWYDDADYEYHPTHWMQLPEPPSKGV